ncbi:MAG: asparagine synthase (glutamine-hydrolyzing) [Planctomycetota bacterium]
MCGIVGMVVAPGRDLGLTDAHAARWRDTLAHRGPDDAGLWRDEQVLLGHRRLAILDPTPGGHQPYEVRTGAADDRPDLVLSYNGELYNDAALRDELPGPWRTRCDTETLASALHRWADGALPRLRGMYAFAAYDVRGRSLTLTRDPLGVKPLFYWRGPGVVVFASEIAALVAHPLVPARPDPAMVRGYATTIRTVLDDRTMYEGVRALRPGEALRLDLTKAELGERRWMHWAPGGDRGTPDTIVRTRDVITESVRAHLRSDVPTCALLSGGLDSTIISFIARASAPHLRTYCAGDPHPEPGDDRGPSDLEIARDAAAFLDTDHAEAHLDDAAFLEGWRGMVQHLRTPMSTPNEVAIHAVAARLRADGCIVTLSGEGADELFAGYDVPLRAAAEYLAADEHPCTPGEFALRAACWVPVDGAQAIFREGMLDSVLEGRWLERTYDAEFDAAAHDAGGTGLEAFSVMLRRVNLTGLVHRLDTATMAASVEGRTPFADARVAGFAESVPIDERIAWDGPGARTKIPLREAFRADLPGIVTDRPKASFPLPFQRWAAAEAPRLLGSALLAEWCQPEALAFVAEAPAERWHLAWPLINLAMWGETL